MTTIQTTDKNRKAVKTNIRREPTPVYEAISPDEAAAILARTEARGGQRTINAKHVERLAAEMEGGHFNPYNGEFIKICTDGACIDGQHRLSAIVKVGRAIMVGVIYGLEFCDVFGTLETSKQRSAADALHALGYTNCNHLAGSIRVYLAITNSGDADYRQDFGVRDVITAAQSRPGIAEACNEYWNIAARQPIAAFSRSIIGGFSVAAVDLGADTDQLETYLMQVCDVTPAPLGSAPRVTRTQVTRNIGKKSAYMSTRYKVAVLISGWNQFIQGRTYNTGSRNGVNVYRSDWAFPEVMV